MLRPMFGMGFGELLMIALIALLFLGPEKLPDAAKHISKGIRDLRKQTKDLQQTIEHDTQLGSAMREIKSALRGDDLRPPPRAPGTPVPGTGAPRTPVISSKSTTGSVTAPTGGTDGTASAEPAAASPVSAATDDRRDGADDALERPAATSAPTSKDPDVRELAARLIRPASASVPQADTPAADAQADDEAGPPTTGSGAAHG